MLIVRFMINIVKEKKRFSLFFISLFSILLTACNNTSDSAVSTPPLPPPNVKVAQAISKEMTQWDEYTGRIEAVNEVQLRARVSGYIEKVQFAAGEKVKKGDLLFLIDNKPYKSQLNYANAEQEKAKVKYELAKNDLARAEKLVAEKAISVEEFDMRSHAVREASAALQSTQASVYAAQLNVSYCEIRAPISGRISREMLTEGNLVNIADNTVLATIVSLNPVYVYVDADESAILNYRKETHHELNGTPVSLALNGDTKTAFQGHIDYVAPKEDTKTGTIALRGVFDNPDELLRPGFFARMRVQSQAPYQALLLPDKAIGTDQSQHFVWVVKENNQVEYRKVTLGMRDNNWRVIREGVNAQEWIVIDGVQKLRPNTQVNAEHIDVATSPDTH
ncbi:MAG: hypothetical protein RLZZ384_229 [Pseudomonadota bacterium]|jgi:multidrug efflux system membrane fusion protein